MNNQPFPLPCLRKQAIDVKLENETALLEGEIDESIMQILHNTLSRYKPTTVYNLDVIISVGYRVHSKRGVQFRRWANSVPEKMCLLGNLPIFVQRCR